MHVYELWREEKTSRSTSVAGRTYTVPSRTNMSCRGSFIRFLHSQSMRKPTLAGWFVLAGSVDGRAILCDLCEEKRSSRPPLRKGLLDGSYYTGYMAEAGMGMCGVAYVNSTLMGIVDDMALFPCFFFILDTDCDIESLIVGARLGLSVNLDCYWPRRDV